MDYPELNTVLYSIEIITGKCTIMNLVLFPISNSIKIISD